MNPVLKTTVTAKKRRMNKLKKIKRIFKEEDRTLSSSHSFCNFIFSIIGISCSCMNHNGASLSLSLSRTGAQEASVNGVRTTVEVHIDVDSNKAYQP